MQVDLGILIYLWIVGMNLFVGSKLILMVPFGSIWSSEWVLAMRFSFEYFFVGTMLYFAYISYLIKENKNYKEKSEKGSSSSSSSSSSSPSSSSD